MVRISVRDPEKAVSFRGDAHLARCVVAGCATNPDSLEALLLQMERYSPGVSSLVTRGLVSFDTHYARGDDPDAFDVIEVVDEPTAWSADRSDGEGLLAVDLIERHVASDLTEPPSLRGTLNYRDETNGRELQAAYSLGDEWAVIPAGTRRGHRQ